MTKATQKLYDMFTTIRGVYGMNNQVTKDAYIKYRDSHDKDMKRWRHEL